MKNSRKFYEQPCAILTVVSDCDLIRTSGEMDHIIELGEIGLNLK